MAVMLECRVQRKAACVTLIIPAVQAARAYMLLDALRTGGLHAFSFGACFRCSAGEADVLTGEGMTLAPRTMEAVKAVMLRVALCPQEASWLHADVQTADGDIAICFE